MLYKLIYNYVPVNYYLTHNYTLQISILYMRTCVYLKF